ncbi:orc1/cdc6 family replication initiation protein [Candidatus Pacearchaeota archaeon]|nr:orc1/cdc6 family replication initiation protein [Candidatus Pacearchaeota archaeon]
MVEIDKIDKIFDSVVQNSIFKNKTVLQSNYTPETIVHREEQIENIALILAPSLRGERVSNLFLYGNTGTGKTLSIQHVGSKLLSKNREMGWDNLQFVYVNCKLSKSSETEYRILARIISALGGSVPSTGLPTSDVYARFIDLIDKKKQIVLIVLDEIDQAVEKISDNFIYSLTRLNSELKNAQINIVGISNNATFMDHLDPRVRSSLGEEEIIFSPYNALQLQDILKKRADKAFNEGILEEGVIAKCAAYAAREHGDARRALDLLRVAAEISERESRKKISLDDIDVAKEKIERDRMLDIISGEPKQFQLVLYAIMNLEEKKLRVGEKGNINNCMYTGEVYNAYQEMCNNLKVEVLTQRRISDILGEFDMLGLINANEISKGRYGRTREIKLMLPANIKLRAREIVEKSLEIELR